MLASVAAGSAKAGPPAKLAEQRCLRQGGAFSPELGRYGCNGVDSSAEFSFMDNAQRLCLNSYKGITFNWSTDPATGQWSYTCVISY